MADAAVGTVLKLINIVEGLSGINLNLADATNNVAQLNARLLEASVNLGVFSDGFQGAFKDASDITKKFNYELSSSTQIMRTFGTQFREPIRDIQTINDLLLRSEQIFGRNSAYAQFFVQDLAKIESEAGPLRDTFLDLIKLNSEISRLTLEGKTQREKDGVAVSDLEDQSRALARVTQDTLELKLFMGELDREQYNRLYMYTLLQKDSIDSAETAAHKTNKIINETRSLAVSITQMQIEAFNKSPEMFQKGIGYIVSGGNMVLAEGTKYLTNMMNALQAQFPGEKTKENQEQFDLQSLDIVKNAKQPVLEEARSRAAQKQAKAMQEYYASDAYKKYQEDVKYTKETWGEEEAKRVEPPPIPSSASDPLMAMKEAIEEILVKIPNLTDEMKKSISGELMSGSEFTESVASLRVFTQELGDQLKAIGQLEEGERKRLQTSMLANQARVNDIINTKNAREEYAKLSATINASLPGIQAMATLRARSGVASTDVSEYTDMVSMRNSVALASAKIEKQMELMISMRDDIDAEIANIQSSGLSAENKAKAIEAIQKNRQQVEAQISGLATQQLDLQNNILKAVDNSLSNAQVRSSYIRAELDYNKQLVALQDSMAVGIGANVALRERAAGLALKEAQVQKEVVNELDRQISQASSPAEAQELEKRRNEAMTKYVSLQKEALDMTQKLREGYLEAIEAMNTGQGMFMEIVLDQSKSLGALIRTTEEVPRVLKTGAGSGGILAPTYFGPGGISGGFDPDSPEYSKHVIKNMDQIQESIDDLNQAINESADKTASSVGIAVAAAMKGRPEYQGQAEGAALPGGSGPLLPGSERKPGAGKSSSEGGSATSGGSVESSGEDERLSAKKPLEDNSGSSQANAPFFGVSTASLNVQKMIDQISSVVQDGVVKGVTIGVERALKQLASA